MLESPREAAERARVYRRGTRQKPRDRWLRAVALIGSLLLHFAVLVGAVLGPAYVPPPPPEHPGDALQVRLIEKKKEEPPPPPPVRGTPPKERGPVHRGGAARVAVRTARTDATTPELPAVPAAEPIPVPTLQPPVIDVAKRTSVPVAQQAVAAPPPPLSLPTPAPTPDLAPVPLAAEPPTITLDTPPAAKPVPPAFQPEPPRKPQLEGNRPIPPPASLAMPELPAQAVPTLAPPTVALDTRVPPAVAPTSVVLARPQVAAAAAPPVPDLQPVPLPAQAAPQVNLQPQISAPAPIVVATERPQVQAPAITVAAAEPQLEAVPVAPLAPSLIEQPRAPAPAAPKLDVPAPPVAAIAVARPAIARAPAAVAPTPAEPATAQAASAAPATEKSAANQAPASAPDAAEARAADQPSAAAGERDVSTAPDATPQGSDNATPGSPTGKEQSAPVIGKDGSLVLPAPGQGTGREHAGSTAGNAATGASSGQPGDYIQLKPHGDVQIMEHRAPNLGYKPTRFEQDWAPEGESSIDTALRHAVEKTTVKHTFHLPRGVRIECGAMPLFPMALFGCHNPDPIAKAVEPELYQRLNLPSAPLAPPPPAPAASVPKPAVPILLDNTVQCANARVAGGPLPPGCASAANAPPKPPIAPARASSSWVPASDQFQ
ncbi:hypothetical protein ISP17_08405 [Dyella ginsengisoli]|uniref:Uncharacterized protein n=1 Tax=Dyella ginsengisoli TaxID=363848 RepID=A0ABW8JU50_9GAMM